MIVYIKNEIYTQFLSGCFSRNVGITKLNYCSFHASIRTAKCVLKYKIPVAMAHTFHAPFYIFVYIYVIIDVKVRKNICLDHQLNGW